MADPVYARISDLPTATLPLATGDLLEVSQSGTSCKATAGGIFGSGWFAKLAAAFTAFVAPEATHAVNADTLGTGADTPADLHDAAQLTGAIHLDRIPAELTGKNAATATLAANAAAVDGYSAGVGVGKLQPYRGYVHGTYTGAQIYAVLATVLTTVGDAIPIIGGFCSTTDAMYIVTRAVRTDASTITLYLLRGPNGDVSTLSYTPSSGSNYAWSFVY